jgi:serine/threonine-protein kinase
MSTEACPLPDELDQLISDTLAPDRQRLLEAHLAHCEDCRRALEARAGLTSLIPGRPDAEPPTSAALDQVVARLRAEPPSGTPLNTAALDTSALGGPQVRLSFLQPTDRPGFLGRLGQYEIRSVIGRGGMGMVFEGVDGLLKRTVAIKVLPALMHVSDEARARFLREAQAAAALTHENIVTIHAVDQADGLPFLVLQHVCGESLEQRLRRQGRLPFVEVVRIGVQVARGLAAVHEKGWVHRDIKPANILLEHDTGRVKIADFGLAKVPGEETGTLAGTVAGTPDFMSPEQATGGAVDARSDLFSLGVVLYAVCTGASPFRGASPLSSLDRVRGHVPTPLAQVDASLPPWFCGIVDRLLEKDPERRLSSAAKLAQALERSGSAPLEAAPRGGATLPVKLARKKRWAIGAALLTLAAVVTAVIALKREGAGSRPPEPGPQPASGFVISGRPQVFGQLADALAAARDGDVIEVQGNGPYATPPLRTDGRALTIRAADGSRPVFLADAPGPRPFLHADADLSLQGLEVRWIIDIASTVAEVDLAQYVVISNTRGKLALTNCRVVNGRVNPSVGATGEELVLKDCHFQNGVGAFLRLAPGGVAHIEGCQFEGRTALATLIPGQPKKVDRPVTILLVNNTFASSATLDLAMGPPQPLKVTARQNIFDNEHLVRLSRRTKPVESTEPQGLIRLLQSFVKWSDEGNLHRRGGDYLCWVYYPRPTLVYSAKLDIGGWLKLWATPAIPPLARGESVEGTIHFRERPKAVPMEPLRLETVEDQSGLVPVGVGANPDTVGPR